MFALFRDLKAFVLRYWRYFYPAPPAPPKAFAYYDNQGNGHIRNPGWLLAGAPDEGQWDGMKRQMRIVLWRAQHGLPMEAGTLDMRPVGVALRPLHLRSDVKLADINELPEEVPALYPLSGDLASACREHGFMRLAIAAMPDARYTLLRAVHEAHEAAIRADAARRQEQNLATQANPPLGMNLAKFRFETEEQVIAMLTLGALDRPDLEQAAPLVPLRLGVDGEAMPKIEPIPWAAPNRAQA